ncbi:IS630 family transposase [Cyanobacterium aponinum UTEX 3222]|uniref:IS630 family transposase n=1 Tax=Cyanobacterium aponinum TaxID=379064 RepID=UPI00308AE1A6|nr:IS630 family transposase [Cyanobacterium aponinum UTEX 3222]
MPSRIKIEPHLSLQELEQGYRKAKQGIEKIHYQVIWLLAQGKRTSYVSHVTGYSLSWIYELVRSYNRSGAKMLGDQRQHNRGRKPLLDDQQLALLYQRLQSPPDDQGLWNGVKVAKWLTQLLDRTISPQRGWEYLKGLEYRLRCPRPNHQNSSCLEQNEWKNQLAEKKKIQQEYPDADVQVWAEDEHRLGLKPVLRRVWVEKGYQPIARVNWRFQWLWLYGFVEPNTGETYWWLLPYVNTELFNRVLKDFAQHYEIGKNKRVILAMDQAGWHPIKETTEIPEGIHVMLMPSHSPELQPAERLWPLVNEAIANRTFKNLEELEEVVISRCKKIMEEKEIVKGIANFYWWPN